MIRPASSIYTPELEAEILDQLRAGASLTTVCKPERMPCPATVLNWCDSVPGFGERYARAREIGLDTMADDLVAIADDGTRDYGEDEHGNPVVDHDHIQRSKLRVDARKWYLSKLAPKRYGEKIVQEHQGAGGGPLTVEVVYTSDPNA